MKTRRAALGVHALAALLVVIGCASGPSTEEVELRNMAIVRQAHADLAAGNVDAFKAAISPNYVRHCQAMPPDLQELRGTEQFFAFIEEFMVAVPAHQDSISNMIAQGDKVAYVSTITGTQTGPMGDFPASGKTFTLVQLIIQRLENGKLLKHG
ncbi:MAG: ester cyclase [Candidatus Eisenbacteria bacterium]